MGIGTVLLIGGAIIAGVLVFTSGNYFFNRGMGGGPQQPSVPVDVDTNPQLMSKLDEMYQKYQTNPGYRAAVDRFGKQARNTSSMYGMSRINYF